MKSCATYKTGKVSVIMPAYNAEEYIQKAANSVLDQTYQDLELIIIDDGSNDSTITIARQLAAKDNRVIVVEQKNSGKPSIARNTGIARASGQYLSFLDSDDYWLSTRISKIISGMKAHSHWVASFHDLNFVTVDDNVLPGTYLKNVGFPTSAHPYTISLSENWYECTDKFFLFMSIRYAAIHTQSILIDRNLLIHQDINFNEEFIICEDTDLWIRLAMQGAIGYFDQPLSCYRQHPTSITKNPILFSEQALKFHQLNRSRIYKNMDEELCTAYAEKIGDLARQLSYHYKNAGRSKEARASSKLAFNEDPRIIDALMYIKSFVPLNLRRMHF